MSEWISVDERLPMPFETVIYKDDDGNVEAGNYCGDKWQYLNGSYVKREHQKVTHWCALPEFE